MKKAKRDASPFSFFIRAEILLFDDLDGLLFQRAFFKADDIYTSREASQLQFLIGGGDIRSFKQATMKIVHTQPTI